MPGNLVMIPGLPIFVYFLYFCVRFDGGQLWPFGTAGAVELEAFLASVRPTWEALGVYVGWLALQAALQAWAPGRIVDGTELPGGGRLRYRMNGPASLAATFGLVGAGVGLGWLEPTWIHDHFGALLTVMMGVAGAFSVFLYFYGKAFGQAGPFAGSGSAVHDFWMGTGLNPRLPPGGMFDLKFFCEARPGLLLWMLVDLSFAWAQHRTYGFVSLSMVLVCGFQLLYVIDYFSNEPAILTTMDIKHERFGYMLAFGDLVWVPMTYSLQAAYLVHHAHDLSLPAAVGIIALNLGGLALFRAVNNQKNRFRRDPDGARIWGRPAEYLDTARGSQLLVSGFWGLSRHFNYLGDLLMAISWSLPCLFDSPLPWFYPVYFAILLVHRERRDHRLCHQKYGDDWLRYCQRVPWRILPGVY